MSLELRLLKAVLILPFNALVTVPAIILFTTPFVRWPEPYATVAEAVGALLILGCVYGGVRTMMLFARLGGGTPGPWDPPQRLVVSGPYRHVRNPMISSVLFGIAGEGLVFTSVPLLVYALVFLVGNLVYIKFFEEPRLVERFGAAYEEYRRNVPAWLPRMRPWTQGVRE